MATFLRPRIEVRKLFISSLFQERFRRRTLREDLEMFVVNRSAAGYCRGFLARTYCTQRMYSRPTHTVLFIMQGVRLLFAQGRTPASQQMCARITVYRNNKPSCLHCMYICLTIVVLYSSGLLMYLPLITVPYLICVAGD